jgi:hypothetical protein
MTLASILDFAAVRHEKWELAAFGPSGEAKRKRTDAFVALAGDL